MVAETAQVCMVSTRHSAWKGWEVPNVADCGRSTRGLARAVSSISKELSRLLRQTKILPSEDVRDLRVGIVFLSRPSTEDGLTRVAIERFAKL